MKDPAPLTWRRAIGATAVGAAIGTTAGTALFVWRTLRDQELTKERR